MKPYASLRGSLQEEGTPTMRHEWQGGNGNARLFPGAAARATPWEKVGNRLDLVG